MEPPFTGATVQATIARRFVHTPPEVSTIRTAVPAAIYLVAAPELELPLTHPRLGPLVRQLSVYAERPGLPPMPAGQ